MAKHRANITDGASDASPVCSNSLTYIEKKGRSKEKGQWEFKVKTEKQLQAAADTCTEPVTLQHFLQLCHLDKGAGSELRRQVTK